MYNIWEVTPGPVLQGTQILVPVSVVEDHIKTLDEAKSTLSRQTKRCVIAQRQPSTPNSTVLWKVIDGQ